MAIEYEIQNMTVENKCRRDMVGGRIEERQRESERERKQREREREKERRVEER